MLGCPLGVPVDLGWLWASLVTMGSQGGSTTAPKSVLVLENTSPFSALLAYHC